MASSKLRTVGLVALVAAAPTLFLLVVLRGGEQSDPATTPGAADESAEQTSGFSSSEGSSSNTNEAETGASLPGSTTLYTGEPSPIIVEFTASAIEGVAPLSVDFVASASTSSDSKIQNYRWIFGDGFEASGEVVSHSYQASGTYEVRLLVDDTEGFETAASIQIVVGAAAGSTSELVDYAIDPGFENSENGFENYYDKSSTELTNTQPIEGQGSLAASLPDWSNVIMPVTFPWMEGPFAHSLTAEASIRIDERSSETRLELCAVAYWVDDSKEVRDENCVEVDGQEGEVKDVSVQLVVDPEVRLGRIYFWLSSIGVGEANLTIDDAHLVLDMVPG